MRRVLRFLDVDDAVAVQALEANPTVSVRSARLDDLLHSVSVGEGALARAAKAPIKALTPRALRRRALRATRRRVLFADVPAPDEELMLQLRRRFKPEVVATSEYLGIDLAARWGYDGVG